MTSDDELRRLFQADASNALEAGGVQALISEGIDRRRRRRQTSAVVGVTLTVAGLAVGANAVGSGGHKAASKPITHLASPSAVLTTPSLTPSPSSSPRHTGQTSQDGRDELFRLHPDELGVEFGQHYADLWHLDDIFLAKSEVGTLLLDKKPIPDASPIAAAQHAFYAAGNGKDEIAFLSALWGDEQQDVVITVAGQQLLDGKTLPTG